MSWETDIYQEYKDKIHGFILFHIKSESLAQDLTHDVFVKFYSQYRPDSVDNIESTIWTIVRNRIVDHHRKVAHSRKYQDYLWTQINASHGPDINIEYEETKALFKTALQQLTPQQWKIYNMVKEQGLSYFEISTQLDISTNTVKNHMVAALKVIRTFLRNQQEIIFYLLCSIPVL